MERTLRLRACISLTCIWPFDAAVCGVEDEDDEPLVAETVGAEGCAVGDADGILARALRDEGGGCCILNSGA